MTFSKEMLIYIAKHDTIYKIIKNSILQDLHKSWSIDFIIKTDTFTHQNWGEEWEKGFLALNWY